MIRQMNRAVLGLLAALMVLSVPSTPAQADEVTDLIAILESDAAAYDKDVACRRLAVVGTPAAVDAIAALLDDEQLATSARTALDGIAGPEAARALRSALAELSGAGLVGVIESLGTRGDTEAVPALGRLLHSADPMAASAAAYALGRIGGREAAEALVAGLSVTDEAVRASVGLGCIACAVDLAAAGDTRLAQRVVDAVRRPDLPSAVVGAATYRSILWRGDAGARLLVRHLYSNDPELSGMALQLIREMPGARVTAAVGNALNRIPSALQAPVIEALGHRGDAAALPAVSEAARSGAPGVRVVACRALAQIGDASAVDTLLAAAVSPDESVATAAANALAALQGDGIDATIAARLADADPAIRVVALRAAGQRRMAEAIPALIEAASAQGEVRHAAIRALGQTCGPDRLPDLVGILVGLSSDEEIGLAETALSDTASRIEDKQVVADALVAGLEPAATQPKAALLRLLRTAPVSSALNAVRASLGETAVQDTAYAALGEWPTPEAAPDLLALAKAGGEHRDLGLRGYIRLIGSNDLTPEQKMAMCNEAAALVANDGETDQLLGALATVPTVEALDMVMSHLDNPALSARVCWAAVTVAEPLEQSHPAQVVDALTRVLEVMDNPNMERRVRSSRDRAAEASGQ